MTTATKSNYPLGIIVAYMGSVSSGVQIVDDDGSSWLWCDGSLIDQNRYSGLYQLVSDRFGVQGQFFNLPDIRGYFVRVVDIDVNGNTSSRDMDLKLRTPRVITKTPQYIASFQNHSAGPHIHGQSGYVEANYADASSHEPFVFNSPDSGGICSQTDIYSNGSDTRPNNAAFNFIIRVLSPGNAPTPPTAQFGIPVGSIVYNSTADAPLTQNESWLAADGSVEPQKRWVAGTQNETPLFQTLGVAFGEGGPAGDTFSIPDLRGYFIRGNDSSPAMGPANNDPDVASRAPINPNCKPSDVASTQQPAVTDHTHTIQNSWGYDSDGDDHRIMSTTADGNIESHTGATLTQVRGGPDYTGADVRPINIALAAAIVSESPSERLPIGSIVQYGGSTDPAVDGAVGDVWLICDGRTLKGTYPAYSAMFNSLFSTPPAAISIPDIRGRFIRGFDPTNSIDQNDGRAPMFANGNAGLTGVQPAALGSHYHQLVSYQNEDHNPGGPDALAGNYDGGDPSGRTDGVQAGVSSEVRPINVTLHT